MKSFDTFQLSSLPQANIYRLLISCVTPRPIALITTLSTEGVVNAAPFSFFNAVSSSPPLISFSVSSLGPDRQKHTLSNVLATKELVVNIPSVSLLEAVTICGANYPADVSEVEQAGLNTLTSSLVKPPRIAESPVQMECKLYQSIPLGEGVQGSATLVLAEVLCVHVDSEAISADSPEQRLLQARIDEQKLDPLARLGGIKYSSLGEIIERGIPKV